MIGKIFFKGLMAVLPAVITLALLLWFYTTIEGTLGKVIKDAIGPKYYFNGLGLLVGLVIVFFVGASLNAWIVQRLYQFTDRILKKIPFVKTLYGSVCDLMNFFKSTNAKQKGAVVMVHFHNVQLLGLVTRENFNDLPEGFGSDDSVAVYVPLSYQLGGLTLIVPKSSVTPIDMSIEKAMRFAVTAGMQINPESLTQLEENKV